MSKNKVSQHCNFDKENRQTDRPVNRKRSQRWLSEETKLYNKYGLSNRYESRYSC